MSEPGTIRIAIAGASGYGGAEALGWLIGHPVFEVCGVSSRSASGEPLPSVHPHLRGFRDDLTFCAQPVDLLETEPDAVVLALPHCDAASHAHALLEARPQLRLVDLSGDHRLNDPEQYERAYGAAHPHPDELTRGRWLYGLPELNREVLTSARCVANPGCFATGAVLAALPLARHGLIEGAVRHVAITGSSGSGAAAKATTHHPERVEDVKAYKVLGHQHVPEILRCLDAAGLPQGTPWQMVPQSGPFARGIFTTLFVDLSRDVSPEEIHAHYARDYADEPFVRMVDATPRLGHVRHTNFCDISVHVDGRTVVVLSAIDNLAKGMASQAVQNLNLMFGLPEAAGLLRPGSRT